MLDETTGVVLELRSCGPKEKIRTAREALAQIREKRYVEGLLDFECLRYWGIGVAFSGRSCAVEIEALQPEEGGA